MPQKGCACLSGVTQCFHGGSRRKKELGAAARSISMDDVMSSQQDLCVRIIHAGGIVERYKGAIHASRLMEKYPKMCIARPDVFKQPHESVVECDEFLLPGQKFYLVPRSTLKKLKRKHPEKLRVGDEPGRKADDEKKADSSEEDTDDSDDSSAFSAKDFYVSGNRLSVLRRGMAEKKKGFTPPIKKTRRWQGTGWEPSLDSVEELSP